MLSFYLMFSVNSLKEKLIMYNFINSPAVACSSSMFLLSSLSSYSEMLIYKIVIR